MKFKYTLLKYETNEPVEVYYDNINSTLKYEDGSDVMTEEFKNDITPDVFKRRFYISLGMSCNFSCEYCLQKNLKKENGTDEEIEKIANDINNEDVKDKWVGFWGGEPLLYLDEIKKIISKVKHKDVQYSIVTNGSLMTMDTAKYLVDNGFIIMLSYDAMSQTSIRGIDPLDKHNEVFRWLIKYPKFTISTTLYPDNIDTSKRLDYIESKLGVREFQHGGSGIVYNYHKIGNSIEEYKDFAEKVYNDIMYGEGTKYGYYHKYINYFLNSIKYGKSINAIATKCDIENPDTYKVVSLKKQIISCHNFAGNLPQYNLHHPEKRDLCYNCPVVHICKGSCPMVDPKTPAFKINCESKYEFYLSLLRVAIEKIFGFEYVVIQLEKLKEQQ